jgi:N-acyl homoserine lactone hydrolase
MNRPILPAAPPSRKSWDDIFNHPCAVSIQRFNTGMLDIPMKGALNLKHPNARGIKNERLAIPVFAYLLQHPEFGHYLLDAGLDGSYQSSPYGRVSGLLVKALIGKVIQEKGRDTASQAKSLGADLKGVFFTHLHFDHIAGAVDLAPDIQYAASDAETMMSVRFFFQMDHLKEIETLYSIDFSGAPDLPFFGPSADIFGDGSLWALPTPGHSRGHLSYLVNNRPAPSLVLGDACFFKSGLEKKIGPGTYSSDMQTAQRTLEKLADFKEMYPQVNLLYGHE